MSESDVQLGSVTFVGSGPSDLGLLTLSGARALGQADVVVTDPSIDAEELTEHTAAHATVEVVGDDELNQLLSPARDGLTVVRIGSFDEFTLPTGDAFSSLLEIDGVRVNVVPGISRWSAALTYGAVRAEGSLAAMECGSQVPAIDEWPSAETLVLRTSGRNLPQVAAQAIHRYGATGQVLQVCKVATTSQSSDTLTWREVKAVEDPEVFLIVGPHIESHRRAKVSWFENKPLFNWRLLIPRTKDDLGQLVDQLAGFGAKSEIVATLSIEPPRTEQGMERAVRGLVDGRYLWLVLTSPHSVGAIAERLREYGLDSRALSGVSLAAVGRGTAEALLELGLMPDLVPVMDNTVGGLANEFPSYDELLDPLNRVLVPSADVSVEALVEGLGRLGWEVEDVTAYRTVRAAPPPAEVRADIKTGMFDAAVFTSATAVRNMIGIAGKPHAATLVAAIGPATAAACEMHGLKVDVIAKAPTYEALAESLAAFADKRREAQNAAGLPTLRPSQRKRRRRRTPSAS
ncbi:uroporphyrinogen-III synthase [Tessaracoccus caeni]|uniref:uroporphyrinogen-III synthase n=1 Tax=Tessaracoccus caeni TaxID=3031239 RepID=UPI0023DA5822|nr:uroporphyrinogen-III synthase [Tessaracoccus caeni]MDF1487751.1 uroporphyrinogen-III synthase [Tessaracoccus caeni]